MSLANNFKYHWVSDYTLAIKIIMHRFIYIYIYIYAHFPVPFYLSWIVATRTMRIITGTDEQEFVLFQYSTMWCPQFVSPLGCKGTQSIPDTKNWRPSQAVITWLWMQPSFQRTEVLSIGWWSCAFRMEVVSHWCVIAKPFDQGNQFIELLGKF